MVERTIIQNADIVTTTEEIDDNGQAKTDQFVGSIEIIDGEIKQILRGATFTNTDDAEVIDGTGLTALPGFIDIHTHAADGAAGYTGDPESMLNMAEAKAREGVTGFQPTSMTDTQENYVVYAKAAKEAQSRNTTGAEIIGLHIEGPNLNEDWAGAQNKDQMRTLTAEEIQEITDIFPVRIVSLAPEMFDANSTLVPILKERGIIPSIAHSGATYDEAMTTVNVPGSVSTHFTHFGNRLSNTSKGGGAMAAGLTATVKETGKIEIIADGIHIPHETIKFWFDIAPMSQIMMITDSMEASHQTPDEEQIIDFAGVDVVIVRTDDGQYKAITKESQGSDYEALAGSMLKFNDGVKTLMEATGRSLREIVPTLGYNQAQSLGLEDRGILAEGKRGDVVLVDNDINVKHTIVGGDVRYSAEST